MSFLQKTAIFCCLILVLYGCGQRYDKKSFYALGTIIDITLQEKDISYFDNIKTLINTYEKSITNAAHDINTAKKNEKVTVSNEIVELLKQSSYYYNLSNGHFDITIATITSLYGFPEGPFKIPNNKHINKAKTQVGFHNLKINYENNTLTKSTDILIDTGAFSKGTIVDKTVEYLKSVGVKSAIVNAGGDLYCIGDKNENQWTIAIKHPDENSNLLSTIFIKEKAVATSGDYERSFEENGKRINHIFDAITFSTSDKYKSMSVIADNTETADALSTVYYLLPVKEIKKLCQEMDTPVLIYTKTGEIIKLCGWDLYEKKE